MTTSRSPEHAAPISAEQSAPFVSSELPDAGVELHSTNNGNSAVESKTTSAALQNVLQNHPKTSAIPHGNIGNDNARRSGRKAFFATGRFHDRDSRVRRAICALMGELEEQIRARYGEVSTAHQLAISAVLRAEGGIRLLMKWRATEANLERAEKRQIERDIVGYTETQLRAFAKLGLSGAGGVDDGDAITAALRKSATSPAMQADHKETPVDNPDAACAMPDGMKAGAA
jgi:hypothetical protein